MIIVWTVVIVVSLIIEVLTYDLVTIFFVPAGIVCLILAATGVLWWIHIIVFVGAAILFVASLRPVLKRILIKPTIATQVTDTMVGQKVRLAIDAADGKSLIKVNGVEWTAHIEGGLNPKKDEVVEVIRSESNVFIVKPVTNIKGGE